MNLTHPPIKSRSLLTPRLLAAGAVAVLTLAACGDDDDDAAGATTEATAEAPAATPAATEAAADTTASDRAGYGDAPAATEAATDAAAGDGVVGVADTDLGQIVADSSGMAVYIFLPDNAGAPTCTADCAGAWPPFTVADAASQSGGDGIDAAMLGTATHPEAGTQVTYNGWPLYYFSGDGAPGETNGNGQGGVWYVIDPAGNPIDAD